MKKDRWTPRQLGKLGSAGLGSLIEEHGVFVIVLNRDQGLMHTAEQGGGICGEHWDLGN